MSVQIDMTERQLRFGVLKLALALAFGLLLAATIVSFLIESNSIFMRVPFMALLIAVGLMLLANGCLAVLHIIDWFEKRRAKREAANG